MDNALTPSSHISDPYTAVISARLAAIEGRLDEISRYLDEMRNLVTALDRVPPNRQCTIED